MNLPGFSSASFVKAKLLQQPLYREDGGLWDTLRAERNEIAAYFSAIGQQLVVDEGDGFAFLRQIEPEGDERVPRLAQRRRLSYDATLLLVCLREEFCRFDTSAEESSRLVKSRDELHLLVGAFLRETNNQVRDVRLVDAAIQRLMELGFLKQIGDADQELFELMRIVKARLTPNELQVIKEKLQIHAES
ncbi:MAG: hypothetical protein QOJ64_2135 [Acidobacteriota bacterium]|jgi:hypothetical protein|nr:hypothetical protein [Acidobacteriota bacterium]